LAVNRGLVTRPEKTDKSEKRPAFYRGERDTREVPARLILSLLSRRFVTGTRSVKDARRVTGPPPHDSCETLDIDATRTRARARRCNCVAPASRPVRTARPMCLSCRGFFVRRIFPRGGAGLTRASSKKQFLFGTRKTVSEKRNGRHSCVASLLRVGTIEMGFVYYRNTVCVITPRSKLCPPLNKCVCVCVTTCYVIRFSFYGRVLFVSTNDVCVPFFHAKRRHSHRVSNVSCDPVELFMIILHGVRSSVNVSSVVSPAHARHPASVYHACSSVHPHVKRSKFLNC